MTQKELSEKTGISQSRISEFESGNRSMNSENIDKIFDVLEVNFAKNGQQQWELAEECAKILKEKGIRNINKMSKEDVSTLVGKTEILALKEYSDTLYDKYCMMGVIDEKNNWNYMKTLIRFHLSLLK